VARLRTLHLAGNMMGEAGLVCLLPGLASAPLLTVLTLDSNSLGNGGAVALATGLRRGVGERLRVGGGREWKRAHPACVSPFA
jgi:hypothetical protein